MERYPCMNTVALRHWSALLVAILVAGCNRASTLPADRVQLKTVTSQELVPVLRAAGAPVVLVNMWASWCGPCREEFPDLIRLQRQYRDKGLRVVLVSWDGQAEDARKYLAAQGVDFPSYLKTSDESDQKFIDVIEPRWTGALPTTFIYDAQGKLRHLLEGPGTYALFEEKVQDVWHQPKGDKP